MRTCGNHCYGFCGGACTLAVYLPPPTKGVVAQLQAGGATITQQEAELVAQILAAPPILSPELAAIFDDRCVVCRVAPRAPRGSVCDGCAHPTSNTNPRRT